MSRYDHKIETSLEGIEHLSKDKKPKGVKKMMDGKGDNKLVITVAPQKLICPKGKT